MRIICYDISFFLDINILIYLDISQLLILKYACKMTNIKIYLQK